MGRMIELMAKDGHSFSAYRANPIGTPSQPWYSSEFRLTRSSSTALADPM